MNSDDVTPLSPVFDSGSMVYESAGPLCIGSGSFATVYVTKGNPVAFKVVHHQSESKTVLAEFEVLRAVYENCRSIPGFMVPGPKGYFDPHEGTIVFRSGRTVPVVTAGPSSMAAKSVPTLFDGVSHIHHRAMYAMDRVHRFPEALSRVLAEKYLPASVTDLPFLLRIYLGKVVRSTGFINTRKFPVDSERYEYLRRTAELTLPEFPPLPPVRKVARYMGQTLAKVHFRAGYDTRDIEFVCGGDGWAEACFYIIDFNQVSSCPFLCM